MQAPLPIGTEVPPFGKILDVWQWSEKYRSYLLRNEQGLHWLPAAVVERGKEVTNER